MSPDTCARCGRVGGFTEVFRFELDQQRAEYVCIPCMTGDERGKLHNRLTRCRSRLLETMFDTTAGKRTVIIHDRVH